ncbi:hypothetical protein [Haloechinothrix salitolerans]|uniref:Uncharacterized protein n=1 Tax=Haloechinothrix salitolerans TaxID=926830 RepID=A0ABW2C730_9PSEU
MNTVAQQRNARKYCTVAELVARERAAYTPYRRPRQQHRERQLQPVTELLRREGIEFEGEDTPTLEMPTTRIHVNQLMRREAEPAQSAPRAARGVGTKVDAAAGTQSDKRKGGKFGAISSAAVLCGLTVAGLIALKPTTASGPADTLADAAGTGDRVTSEARLGGVQPTSTVLNASNNVDTSQRTTGGGAAQQQSSSIGGGVRATQQASEPTTAAPGPSRTVAPVPAEETRQSEPTSRQSDPSQENEDDGGLIDDTVDTVDDTLDPVTEPVEDTLDPVTGTISGTLDLLG